MGISSKKTTQKVDQTQQQNATTTPVIPDWVAQNVQNWQGMINNFAGSDPNAFVAPANDLQQAAYGNALNFTPPDYSSALAMAMQAGQGGPNTASWQGYTAPQMGPASLVNPQGYTPAQATAAQMGNIQIAPAVLAAAPGAITGGSSASAGRASAERASAASMLDGFDRYAAPTTEALVDATLAEFDDQYGRQQAQMAAQAAAAGAFGGSRYGIREAQFASDSDRQRALTDAQLRDNAFSRQVQMAQYDATNRQNTSLQNAQLGTQASIANAGFDTTASVANANNSTQLAALQANLAHQTELFNAGAQNQFALQQAQMDYNTALQNAGFTQQTNMANAGWQNEAGQFNSQLGFAGQQANQNALNNFQQLQAQLDAQAGQFNANLGAQMGQFNANQQDDWTQNLLAAAGLTANIQGQQSAQQQAMVALQQQLGLSQWQIEQMAAQSPMTLMALLGQLQQTIPYNIFTGQNVTGTTNVNGTTTTKQSGSLFDQLLGLATVGLPFLPK